MGRLGDGPTNGSFSNTVSRPRRRQQLPICMSGADRDKDEPGGIAVIERRLEQKWLWVVDLDRLLRA